MAFKKKLVYILNQYSAKEGSHFYHILHLLEEIARNKVEVVLVIEKAQDIPKFDLDNITVVVQKKSGVSRPLELYSILKKLNKQGFKKTFVRISQNGAIPAILVSKFHGGVVFYWQSGTTHAADKAKPFSWKKYLYSTLPFNFVKKNTTYFVTGPETMVTYYKEEIQIKEEKLVCLYNDIDISRFAKISEDKKIEIKKELNLPLDKKIVLFVKRMSAIKGILFYSPYVLEKNIDLLRAQNYICCYLGDGSEKNMLQEELTNKGMDDVVKLVGNMPNAIIQKYYQIADIFINPTLEEGFPRVLIEGMASGLPIVTTNAGGTIDIVGEYQKQFMVDCQDRDGFADKLSELICSEDAREKLIEENIESVKRFSTENVAKMYVSKIFKE